MGWKKFTNFLKKVVKPVAAIAAIVYPPLLPLIGSAIGASAATATVVGAVALGTGASIASGDSLEDALKTGALSGLTAGLLSNIDSNVISGLNGGSEVLAGGEGLLSGGAGSLTAGITAADIAAAETALAGTGSLTSGISLADIAAAEAGTGLLGGGSLTAGLTVADIAALEAGLPSGLGSLTTGLTAADIAAAEAALPTATTTTGSLTTGLTAADIAAAEAGLTTAGTGAAGGSLTAGVTAADVAAADAALPASGLLSGLTTAELSKIISGTLKTGGGLLQQQTSKEAAEAAQARINAETEAAKQGAAFRPIGMTTRFGTSNFKFDPVTGKLISAGYDLTPEAKAQQDRFMALSEQGLTQAEAAQGQFAPLQTGAQSLFNLGNKYLAQSPEEVAQRYITSQMSLLQPGRELELANLQNKLLQQGRSGVAVAQGGSLGATTPELQALFNARATQEAKLAAEAELAGQQQVTFGAGLLTKGAGAMGDYYSGQTAAYSPYTTAFGKAQGLETLAQKPYDMSTALATQIATAGNTVGNFGLRGAELSNKISTGTAATTNPYSTVLAGLSDPTSTISQGVADYIKNNWL